MELVATRRDLWVIEWWCWKDEACSRCVKEAGADDELRQVVQANIDLEGVSRE